MLLAGSEIEISGQRKSFHEFSSVRSATEAALRDVVAGLAEHGHAVERYGLCLSRAMGLPVAAQSASPMWAW